MYFESGAGAAFEKNRHGIYTWCSEIFSEMAGMDSPADVINKTDDDLIWQGDGHHCDLSDSYVQKVKTLNQFELVRTDSWNKVRVAKHADNKEGVAGNILLIDSSEVMLVNQVVQDKGLYIRQLNTLLDLGRLGILADLLTSVKCQVSAVRMNCTERTVSNHKKRLHKLFLVKNNQELCLLLNRYSYSSTILTLREYKMI